MPFKVAHAVKLIPVLITGTFTASPSFLQPPPAQNINYLLQEKKCYIAAKNQENNKYLLACRTYPIGKSLYFYFYDSENTGRHQGHVIPVKHLKLESPSESETDEKNINLDFLWGDSVSLKAKELFNEQWQKTIGKELDKKKLDLSSFCKEARIMSIKEKTTRAWKLSWLKCVYLTSTGEKGPELWLNQYSSTETSGERQETQ